MTNAEIFRKAADYIREYGLEKDGSYGRSGGPRCLAGAMMSAARVPDALLLERQLVIVCERLRDVGQTKGYTTWNDAPERTAAEVIALLDGLAFDEDLKAAAQSPLPADSCKESVPTTLQTEYEIPQLVEA